MLIDVPTLFKLVLIAFTVQFVTVGAEPNILPVPFVVISLKDCLKNFLLSQSQMPLPVNP